MSIMELFACEKRHVSKISTTEPGQLYLDIYHRYVPCRVLYFPLEAGCMFGHSSYSRVVGVVKKCISCSGDIDHTLIVLYHYQLHWRMMLQTAHPSPQHYSGNNQISA